MILAIKTHAEPATVYLLDNTGKEIDNNSWQAGYELSQTLLKNITDLLKNHNLELKDLTGIVVYNGSGGFTSLRLGVLTANTLAYGLEIPVVGAEGDNWFKTGVAALKTAKLNNFVTPNYGRPPHITKPKK